MCLRAGVEFEKIPNILLKSCSACDTMFKYDGRSAICKVKMQKQRTAARAAMAASSE
jgi:hypothetical protein